MNNTTPVVVNNNINIDNTPRRIYVQKPPVTPVKRPLTPFQKLIIALCWAFVGWCSLVIVWVFMVVSIPNSPATLFVFIVALFSPFLAIGTLVYARATRSRMERPQ